MSHQITLSDVRNLTAEVSLASSSDVRGNWKRLVAILPVSFDVPKYFELNTISGPSRRFTLITDAIDAYNAEEG